MKRRSGFVSNSSSSSFVVVVTLPAFREALSRMKEERNVKVIKAVAQDDVCFGIKAKVVKEFSDAGGFSSLWGCDSDGQQEILEKAGVVWPPVDKNGDEVEPKNGEEWYPQDAVYTYTQVLEKMVKEKDWKDQIYQVEVGDGG